MEREKLSRYAEVVVRRGLNLRRGQMLYVEADIRTAEFVREAALQAFAAGASDVKIRWKDAGLDQIRYRKLGAAAAKLNRLDLSEIDFYSKKGAAYLKVLSPDFEVFDKIDAEVLAKAALSEREQGQRYSGNGERLHRTLVCIPNESWAAKVYPGLKRSEALRELWKLVFSCMRLDSIDPLAAWDEFIATAKRRRALLEAKDYRKFHFKSSRTDLELCPMKGAKWYGGCCDFPDTDEFYIPNLPTEEVFTVPDKYTANGFVRATRPLNFQGQLIGPFTLTFREGKVVEYTAEKGGELLRQILESDEGACYLGEMALVSEDSPIAAKRTTFYTTLFDENASCHLALGFGLAEEDKTPAEREALRINHSAVHVDFMIGSRDMRIRGQLKDGSWEDIFVDGKWAEAFL